jgi:hypothetical protein
MGVDCVEWVPVSSAVFQEYVMYGRMSELWADRAVATVLLQ